MLRRALLTAPAASLLLAACSGGISERRIEDPLLAVREPMMPTVTRLRAIDQAWDEVEAGERDRATTRAAFEEAVWSRSVPPEARAAALARLMDDRTPEGQAASRRLVRLMLPTEEDRTAVAVMSQAAGRNGWTEATTALVRSMARPVPGVDDATRTERAALVALHPDRSLEEVVFSVFLAPDVDAVGDLRLDERARADAWALLSRLDPSGAARRTLLAGTGRAELPPDIAALVGDLQAAEADLGIFPSRGEELAWLTALRRGERAAKRGWWSETSRALASLNADQRAGLELRHAEPVRWALRHRPSWLTASRSDLESLLRERFSGREHARRTNESSPTRRDASERFTDWLPALVWGDLLALAVLDEAVHTPAVREQVAQYAAMDRRDHETEYGGLIEAIPAEGSGQPAFRAVLFQPRTRDRGNDYRFVASDDMLRYSDMALAHFHLHVQRESNRRFAGPSPEDLAYAARSGRTCVVFTSVGEGEFNADVYQPDGAVIDVGTIRVR